MLNKSVSKFKLMYDVGLLASECKNPKNTGNLVQYAKKKVELTCSVKQHSLASLCYIFDLCLLDDLLGSQLGAEALEPEK